MRGVVRVFQTCVLVLAALAAWSPASAVDQANEALYLRYCGACHGPGGKGDGIMSGLLKKKPADLTRIAERNGGEFPFNRIMQTIDGTKTVRAHGSAEMPVWGEIFMREAKSSAAQQAEVRGKILMITEYLRSIQQK